MEELLIGQGNDTPSPDKLKKPELPAFFKDF